jgi:hypothetical protein
MKGRTLVQALIVGLSSRVSTFKPCGIFDGQIFTREVFSLSPLAYHLTSFLYSILVIHDRKYVMLAIDSFFK